MLLFLLAHVTLQSLFYLGQIELSETLRARLSVDNEISIPTWFSQILLFVAAVFLAAIAYFKTKENDAFKTRWVALSALFLYLSIDESAMLHEIPTVKLRGFLEISADSGSLSNTWVVLAVPLLAVLGLLFFRFLKNLPDKTRLRFITAAAVYLGGVLGIEVLGSYFYFGEFFYHAIAVALEEGLEMTGIILFIRSLCLYLTDEQPTMMLSIKHG